jgi:Uma2 family endonuclease
MRGTLHLLAPEDGGAFLALIAAARPWARPSWQRYFGATPQVMGFAPLCPDVVFEVVSRSDEVPALRRKMRAYLANGARLAVLVDAYRRVVEIYEPGQDTRILEQPRSVALMAVLPGFELNLASIFA